MHAAISPPQAGLPDGELYPFLRARFCRRRSVVRLPKDGDVPTEHGLNGASFIYCWSAAQCPSALPRDTPLALNGQVMPAVGQVEALVVSQRFVLSIKSECLNRLVPLGENHLRHAVTELVRHYHAERPHQGLNNCPIDPDETTGP